MKKLLTYLCTIFLLAACSNEIPEHNQPVLAKRTLLAYLSANNNLDGDIMQNVQWMYESLSEAKDTCTLVIYYKPHRSNAFLKEAEILEFQTNGFGEINNQPILDRKHRSIDNILAQAKRHKAVPGNSVNRQVMEENLKTMLEIAPSKCYGLLFGSHANGWIPGKPFPEGVSTFAFGDDNQYAINIPELGKTLEHCFAQRNLDFVLFDACMMGIAEVCYELRNATHYCIASVMETPRVGFPYHLFLSSLYKDEIDYQWVCKTVTDFNRDNHLWGTYAAVDCSKMERLASVVKEELMANREKLEHVTPHSIQQYGVNLYTNFSFDIIDMFRKFNKNSVSPSIQQAIDEVVIAKDCMDDSSYPIFGKILTDRNRYCGLGMYLPYTIENTEWNNYYETLGWYEAAGWNELKGVLVK